MPGIALVEQPMRHPAFVIHGFQAVSLAVG
jgi:hypothetical protein